MLARYFLWSEGLRKYHEHTWKELLQRPNLMQEMKSWSALQRAAATKTALERDPNRLLGAIAYNIASLYVVIEGFKEVKLADPVLDRLLASPYVSMLRRYRNAVFHYQPSLLDPRFGDVLDAGEDLIDWLFDVRQALEQFLTLEAPDEMRR